MASLYELTDQYLKLQEMLEDMTASEEAILTTLDDINDEIENKADGYAMIIKMLEADSEACSKEAARIQERSKSFTNRAKSLKKILENNMLAIGKTKIKTTRFNFYISKNAPSLIIEDESKIPAQYQVEQKPKIDTTQLKEDIKNGIEIKGAYLKQTESLKIR